MEQNEKLKLQEGQSWTGLNRTGPSNKGSCHKSKKSLEKSDKPQESKPQQTLNLAKKKHDINYKVEAQAQFQAALLLGTAPEVPRPDACSCLKA